jgi:hypothetical protein
MSSRKRLAAWAGPVHRGHAVVLSVDEKSQIQVLECIKRSKCATMIRDYKRNGTTTVFAVLSVLEGKVIGRCGLRYREQIDRLPGHVRALRACWQGGARHSGQLRHP